MRNSLEKFQKQKNKKKNIFLKDPDMYDGIKSIHIPADRIWKPDILLGNEKNYSIVISWYTKNLWTLLEKGIRENLMPLKFFFTLWKN